MPAFVHSLSTSFKKRLSTFSLLPALSALFKPRDTTMDLDPWVLLVERTLCLSTAHTLRLYISASEKLDTPEIVLERLEVVWMWFNKLKEPPQHEYFVIETIDRRENNLIRRFLLERIIPRNNHTVTNAEDTDTEDSDTEDNTLLGVRDIFQSSRSTSPSILAEEGASTSHVPSPKLSVSDSATLAATKAAHSASESMDKNDKREALDRFLGESYVDDQRYLSGRYVKQIKPKSLNLFELVVLAHVVHREGPKYTRLKNNCFWFTTTLFDLVISIFGNDISSTPEDTIREKRYRPHDPDMPGRWMGLKITASDPREIAAIKQKYKKEVAEQIGQVMLCSFRIIIPY